jgi:hypothetical protein
MHTLIPQDFVAKWKRVTSRERQATQEHFIDLCHLVGHETPNEFDPTGTRFAFEMGAGKTSGGQGWADVAKLGYFGWEYKGKDHDLDKAYEQLLRLSPRAPEPAGTGRFRHQPHRHPRQLHEDNPQETRRSHVRGLRLVGYAHG